MMKIFGTDIFGRWSRFEVADLFVKEKEGKERGNFEIEARRTRTQTHKDDTSNKMCH